ncbi:hypothetical protein HPP92_013240 [Vanilla planifolia]|uniref:Uncharacterized protein n=1 Tax=Vanilla planifolia TaxID=51239 RepID=A0A835QUJ6_VANPL|nr:hypothetical protein HPP92_013240 [Vanilla planifolia]
MPGASPVANFLEGLWPLRPWKFEAITDHCNCWSSTRNFLVSASHHRRLRPRLCTHRPPPLPIEWSKGSVRIAGDVGVCRHGDSGEKSTEPYHLEEGEVVTMFP